MHELTPVVLAASTVQAIGIVIALTAMVGFIVYGLFNIRAGREEVGAELELAANLKPYYDDDTLETKKLDRTLTMGLATLAIIGIGLPVYWLGEPGRQEGLAEDYQRVFADRGEELYTGGAQCINCHGAEGSGGVASYTILDDDNEFVAQVSWLAPALDTVMLRYDREEVVYILNYGRPYSPMPAWGGPGGGPLTEQQVENLVDYLTRITITSTESKAQAETALRNQLGIESASEPINYSSLETGEALFNLGQETGFAAGAYACGRCHTRGWSISQNPADIAPSNADLTDFVDYPDGAGGYGPRLRGGIIPRQFADVEALAEFLHQGAARGVAYGQNGLSGDGMMPGFGDNPNTEDIPDDGMLTSEMIESIARYVRSLGDDAPEGAEPTQDAQSGTTQGGDVRSATDLDDEEN